MAVPLRGISSTGNGWNRLNREMPVSGSVTAGGPGAESSAESGVESTIVLPAGALPINTQRGSTLLKRYTSTTMFVSGKPVCGSIGAGGRSMEALDATKVSAGLAQLTRVAAEGFE